ncbi:MAG: DUF3098 domain-containing protein [Bacteroidales bacterium]|nr:DUF3098 domain-containing protein [Bacteroidales bacterium]
MKKEKNNATDQPELFVFGKHNYKFLLIGLGFILLGFILMAGGGSDSPDEFNEAMFGFRRLTLAPILVLMGFAIEIYAIMSKPKE